MGWRKRESELSTSIHCFLFRKAIGPAVWHSCLQPFLAMMDYTLNFLWWKRVQTSLNLHAKGIGWEGHGILLHDFKHMLRQAMYIQQGRIPQRGTLSMKLWRWNLRVKDNSKILEMSGSLNICWGKLHGRKRLSPGKRLQVAELRKVVTLALWSREDSNMNPRCWI